MTVTESRTAVETRALRMRAAGDDPKTVSTATGLTRDELDKLYRDFPSTAKVPAPPQQPRPTAKPCDQAGCRGIATESAGGWSFCAAHAKAHAEADDLPLPRLIGELLEDASAHSKATVRNLGKRIEADLDRLRGLIAEHGRAERAKREAAEAKAAAKRKVKELEEQLRAAKAALRGGTVTSPGARTCDNCGEPVTRTGSRGPWPKQCGTCRAAS